MIDKSFPCHLYLCPKHTYVLLIVTHCCSFVILSLQSKDLTMRTIIANYNKVVAVCFPGVNDFHLASMICPPVVHVLCGVLG